MRSPDPPAKGAPHYPLTGTQRAFLTEGESGSRSPRAFYKDIRDRSVTDIVDRIHYLIEDIRLLSDWGYFNWEPWDDGWSWADEWEDLIGSGPMIENEIPGLLHAGVRPGTQTERTEFGIEIGRAIRCLSADVAETDERVDILWGIVLGLFDQSPFEQPDITERRHTVFEVFNMLSNRLTKWNAMIDIEHQGVRTAVDESEHGRLLIRQCLDYKDIEHTDVLESYLYEQADMGSLLQRTHSEYLDAYQRVLDTLAEIDDPLQAVDTFVSRVAADAERIDENCIQGLAYSAVFDPIANADQPIHPSDISVSAGSTQRTLVLNRLSGSTDHDRWGVLPVLASTDGRYTTTEYGDLVSAYRDGHALQEHLHQMVIIENTDDS